MIVKKCVLYILILVFSIIFIGGCSANHGDGRDADTQRGNTDNKAEIVRDKNETNENLLKKYKIKLYPFVKTNLKEKKRILPAKK